jgi:hypothetical protein
MTSDFIGFISIVVIAISLAVLAGTSVAALLIYIRRNKDPR